MQKSVQYKTNIQLLYIALLLAGLFLPYSVANSTDKAALLGNSAFIVEIRADKVLVSLGTVVSKQGHVLTWSNKKASTYLVTLPGQTPRTAQLIDRQNDSGLTLLKLESISDNASVARFSRTAPILNQRLYSVIPRFGDTPSTFKTGAVEELSNNNSRSSGDLFAHTMGLKDNQTGAPQLNSCGEVTGVAIPNGGFLERLFSIGSENVPSLGINNVATVTFLTSNGVNFNLSTHNCESALDVVDLKDELALQNSIQAELAREVEKNAKEEIDTLKHEIAKLERLKEDADNNAQGNLEDLVKEQSQLQKQLIEKQREIDNLTVNQESMSLRSVKEKRFMTNALIATIIGAFLMAVALLAFRMHSVRKANSKLLLTEQRARTTSEALAKEKEQRTLIESIPDLMLEGELPQSNIRVALRIPGKSIGTNAGAVTGRSPMASEFIINEPTVSRRHFRITASQANDIFVENISDGNILTVDSIQLVGGTRAVIKHGSQMTIGSVLMTAALSYE